MVIAIKTYWYVVTDYENNRLARTVDDVSDTVQFYGYDANGKMQHFEAEAYHLAAWCATHGLRCESGEHVFHVNVQE